MKTIGIIGGLSWQSSASYYKIMNEEVARRLGGLSSAKLVLSSVNLADFAAFQHSDNWPRLAEMLIVEAQRLERAGCDAILIATNTMHKVYDEAQRSVQIPIIHICDVIGQKAQQLGFKRLGLTGTLFTMETGFYERWLTEKYGLKIDLPQQGERQEIHRIIFEGLCKGIVKEEEQRWFADLLSRMYQNGSEAIILGCTELVMLIANEFSGVPLLDTTQLHAMAGVDFALGAG